MYSEVAWVLISSGIQIQLQIILVLDYFLNYLPVFVTMKKRDFRVNLLKNYNANLNEKDVAGNQLIR